MTYDEWVICKVYVSDTELMDWSKAEQDKYWDWMYEEEDDEIH